MDRNKYNDLFKKIYRAWDVREFVRVEELRGLIFTEVFVSKDGAREDYILFINDDVIYVMFHDQNCCESVTIKEISGDISDLENSPMIMSEVVTNTGGSEWGSFTWSFYKFATIKGYVTISWYGESNGYYSEEVSIYRITKEEMKKIEEEI